MAVQVDVEGRISAGRGWAKALLLGLDEEIQHIVKAPLCPGSLNVVLDEPLSLRGDAAATFDHGSRMLWRASLNGIDVWVYRWDAAPLHIIEVLSSTHLRTRLNIADGDNVTLRFNDHQVAAIAPLDRLCWSLIWLGRRHWFYQGKTYYLLFARGIHVLWLARQWSKRGVISRQKLTAGK